MFKKWKEFKERKIQEAQIKKFGTALDEETDPSKNIESEIDLAVEKIEIEQLREKHFKKEKRKTRLKLSFKITVWILVVGVLVRGLTFNDQIQLPKEKEVVHRTFLKDYVAHVFSFPQSEESKTILEKYSLKPFNPFSIDGNVIAGQNMNNIEIYRIEEIEKNLTEYYVYGTLQTTLKKENKNEYRKMHLKITVFENEGQLMVVKPIEFIVAKDKNFSNDDKKRISADIYPVVKGKESASQKEQEDIKTTIDLFLKTYSEDYNKSLVLTTNENLLPLSKGVKLQFKALKQVILLENELHVYIQVNETVDKLFSSEKEYLVILDKNTKKVKKMEGR